MTTGTVDLSVSTKQTFEVVDLVKFLCAILVAAAHVPIFGYNANPVARVLNYGIQEYLARLAVPFFFMCTGFLVFRKTTLDSFSPAVGIKSAKKTYRFYLIWTLVYAPFILRDILKHPGGIAHGISVFVRDFVFVGSYVHLWYLNASVFAVLLITLLLYKRVKLSWIIGGALVLYLVGLLPTSYFGLFKGLRAYPFIWDTAKFIQKIIVTTRNGFFEGILFVGLGALLAFKPIKLSLKASAIGFACSMLLLLLEVIVLTRLGWIREYDLYLLLVPTVFFLFSMVARMEVRSHKIYRFLRTFSSLIYFTHLWIALAADIVYSWAGIKSIRTGLLFITTLVLSLAASWLIVALSKRKGFKWLKNLYS